MDSGISPPVPSPPAIVPVHDPQLRTPRQESRDEQPDFHLPGRHDDELAGQRLVDRVSRNRAAGCARCEEFPARGRVEMGVDRSGAQRAHGDGNAVAPKLLRHGEREFQCVVLGRVVGGEPRSGEESGGAAHVEQPAVPVAPELADEQFGDHVVGDHVEVDHFELAVQRGVGEVAEQAESGVVDEQIDAFVAVAREQLLARAALRQVERDGFDRDGFAVRACDPLRFLRYIVQTRLIACHEREIVSEFGEVQRHIAAQSVRRSGDDCFHCSSFAG